MLDASITLPMSWSTEATKISSVVARSTFSWRAIFCATTPVEMLWLQTFSREKPPSLDSSKQEKTWSESTSERNRPTPRNCTASTGLVMRREMPKNAEFTSWRSFAVIPGSCWTILATCSIEVSGLASASLMRK